MLSDFIQGNRIILLVKQYRDTGKTERQKRTYQGFERVYTTEDIQLLASLNEWHNTLSRPATKIKDVFLR
jgi:hypothetical protein